MGVAIHEPIVSFSLELKLESTSAFTVIMGNITKKNLIETKCELPA